MPTNRPVLVSGMGIAGPTLAYWLTVHGFETTLVGNGPAMQKIYKEIGRVAATTTLVGFDSRGVRDRERASRTRDLAT
jgi:2-polyprenyl-6-methoxyphenol hydroxylase-like FAD-dependent oxidoreductase